MSAPRTRSGGSQVVEFQDPYAKRHASKSELPSSRKRRRDPETTDSSDEQAAVDLMKQKRREAKQEFRDTFGDVMNFGVEGLTKKQKKLHEKQRLRSLGFTVAKDPKVPYKILQSMKDTHRQRRRKEKKEVKASGVVVAKKKNLFKVKRYGNQKSSGKEETHRTSTGVLKGGVFHVNKRAVGL